MASHWVALDSTPPRLNFDILILDALVEDVIHHILRIQENTNAVKKLKAVQRRWLTN